MCGILFYVPPADSAPDSSWVVNQSEFKHHLNKMKHRGPDESGTYFLKNGVMIGHNRLALNGQNEEVSQPFEYMSASGQKWYLCVNGEIYNSKSLMNNPLFHWYKYQTQNNDCESIYPVMMQFGETGPWYLDGQFAFVLTNGTTHYIARDRIGICSLYYGYDQYGGLYVSSELKSIEPFMEHSKEGIKHVPPGCVLHNTKYTERLDYHMYAPQNWMTSIPQFKPKYDRLYELLYKSVEKRLLSADAGTQVGLFLSGGLDSSIIAAIAQEIAHKRNMGKLKSFSIGLENSPDLFNARKVAEYIGTDHYEKIFTPQEGIESLVDVIHHIESYDVTTVRASTPMYLLAKYMKEEHNIKYALSGEGSDELFGGYLYFRNAQKPHIMHWECVRLVNNLHMFDCLRSHKTGLASSIEVRVPFLDNDVVNYVMNMNPKFKLSHTRGTMEKMVLRNCLPSDLLPSEIVWRQKEQFSDGVGYGWIDYLRDYAIKAIFATDQLKYQEHYQMSEVPSHEQCLYMKLFFGWFSNMETGHCLIEKWEPKWAQNKDPSGIQSKFHYMNTMGMNQ